MTSEQSEAAPAKVNLYLHVVGRRADGYHLLDSLVAFASVGDRVGLAPAAALGLTVDGPFAPAVPDGDGNLALEAARRLAAALGRPDGVAIALTKNLPVAAGLGGGSADAAAVLRVLSRLWPDADASAAITRVAESLGADVPVCLTGRPQFVSGIGEILDPAPVLAGMPIVLVNPGVPLATPAVFRERRGDFSIPGRFPFPSGGTPLPAAELIGLLAERRNDLTDPALRLCPPVAEVLHEIAETAGCRLARMSGSGATCFGLYDNPDSAERAAATLGRARPGWWVRAGRLL